VAARRRGQEPRVIAAILESVAGWIAAVIASMGYLGIVLCMAIESACIPLPSEVIMPFAGFLAGRGRFGLWETALAGAVGCVAGSLAAYAVGATGGRAFLERHGRWVLLTMKDLDRADRWFARYGNTAIFVRRLLPVVRTFISLPAGIARMPLLPFTLLTFAGSFPFCLALAWLGYRLGDRWTTLKAYFHGADAVIGAAVLIGCAYLLWHRIAELKAEARERAARERRLS